LDFLKRNFTIFRFATGFFLNCPHKAKDMTVSAVSNGIQVSVQTYFQGRYFSRQGSLYLFVYDISIENKSNRVVQLLGRHWYIFDTGEGPSEVEGEGVVGKQPVIHPGETHQYQSGCHLRASIGAMEGFYKMINLDTGEQFRVQVPTFQFFAEPRMN
jgi:ApaG protein